MLNINTKIYSSPQKSKEGCDEKRQINTINKVTLHWCGALMYTNEISWKYNLSGIVGC